MASKEIREQKQDKIVSKSETLEVNTGGKPLNEEDLLYMHKPENLDSNIHWNSTFCRKPGH